jgi:pimeloyl-ACP methyl ester carboxylesterase
MTVASISQSAPITFQAQWFDNNKHLAETWIEKITRSFLFCMNNLVMSLVLPASQMSRERVQAIATAFKKKWSARIGMDRFLNKNFTPRPIEVTTPDGVKLRGTFFKNVAASETAPTVICFQTNGILSKEGAYDWILGQAALQEFPYNFVYFDYRGCAESEGTPHLKKNLFLDGESIYQFVCDKLHVPPNDIHFYGWSLGGGVSANVKEIHNDSESRYVNERSFNYIDEVVKNVLNDFFDRRFYFLNSRTRNLLSTGSTWIAASWLSLLNWKIESVKAIENLKGKTLIVHHPEDELMKKEASLYHSLFQRATLFPNIQELNLDRSPSRSFFIHGAPLAAFGDDHFEPEDEISKFLFASTLSRSERILNRFAIANTRFRNQVFAQIAQEFQNGGLYWGSGEDAFYNRNGLSMTDEMRVLAIVKTKVLASD